VLSDRVRLKDIRQHWYNKFLTHSRRHDISKWFSYASKWQCLVKKFLINQSCQKFLHMWLQDSELKNWLSAYPADSKKPFAKFAITQS